MIEDLQRMVAEVLSSAIDALPQGASKEEIRDAVEKALKEHPEVGQYATIEPDDSEAGFRVRIDVRLVADSPPAKPDFSIN